MRRALSRTHERPAAAGAAIETLTIEKTTALLDALSGFAWLIIIGLLIRRRFPALRAGIAEVSNAVREGGGLGVEAGPGWYAPS